MADILFDKGNIKSALRVISEAPEDVEYNLARLEGQLARFDVLFNEVRVTKEIWGNLTSAKQFLAALRLALDPHRIDVV